MHESNLEPSHDLDLVRRRHLLFVLLAFHAGSLDVVGFLALQAFTSVQTGNMVLLGLGAATGDWRLAFHAAVGIACFVLGCLAGARIAGAAREADMEIWPESVTVALRVQFATLLLFAILWWVVDSDPGPAAKVLFLAMNCFGMGIQSGAILRFGSAAEMTTYTTGMLTATMARLANGSWSARSTRSLHMLAAMIAGAAVGGVLLEQAPWSPPLLQLLGLASIIGLATRLSRARGKR